MPDTGALALFAEISIGLVGFTGVVSALGRSRLPPAIRSFRILALLLYSVVADKLVPGIEFGKIVRSYVDSGEIPAAIGQEDEWFRRRMRQHRNPSGDIEVNFADGRWLRVSECRTGDGGCVSIRTDITALKQRQEDLSSQQQRADSANRAHFCRSAR